MAFLDRVIAVMARFLWHIMGFTLTLVILVTLGASYYMVHVITTPERSSEEAEYNFMYSEYPYLRPWMSRLNSKDQFKDIYILSKDSVKLHAYYIPSERQTANTAILVHGHKCSARRMLHLAYMYQHDLKFNVLLPDLRGHGLSGGNSIQMGWNDRKDLQQWIGIADDIFQTPDSLARIVLHGISMGAAATMMTAGEDTPSNVKCFVEDCGYTDVFDEASHVLKTQYNLPKFPIVFISNLMNKHINGWSFSEASALEAVKRCNKPMLFIHGGADTYVPPRMVHELYSAKANNKMIYEPKGVMHARSYHDHQKEYTRNVQAFLNMYYYK